MNPEPKPSTKPKEPTVNTKDRCDACGAQAYVSVDVPALAARLLFCGNHWGKAKPALEAKYGDDLDVDDSFLQLMRNKEQTKAQPVDA